MKAAVITAPGELEIQDIAQPTPGPYEALVKIEGCGLCGTTDRHLIEGKMAHHPADWYPAILGHESVGRVVEVGAKVQKFKVGDRVTRPVALWPGTQANGLYSAWGGFAEYGIVRDDTTTEGPAPDYKSARQHVVPNELFLDQAVAAISISEVASWMNKLGTLQDKVIVIGGTCFAACVMCQCAQSAGAREIITFGRSEKKFTWVKENGATQTLKLDDTLPCKVKVITGGGADYFLDAAGHQTVFNAGLSCLRPGGEAAIYGAPEGFTYQLLLGAVSGDFAVRYLAPADDIYFAETCRQIAAGRLKTKTILTHAWDGLETLPKAVEEQASGQVLKGYIKI